MVIDKRGLKRIMKWTAAGLPFGGVIWASFLPLQTWMQQALILIVLLWLQAFFLLGVFTWGN
jgi:hypothetical protein